MNATDRAALAAIRAKTDTTPEERELPDETWLYYAQDSLDVDPAKDTDDDEVIRRLAPGPDA